MRKWRRRTRSRRIAFSPQTPQLPPTSPIPLPQAPAILGKPGYPRRPQGDPQQFIFSDAFSWGSYPGHSRKPEAMRSDPRWSGANSERWPNCRRIFRTTNVVEKCCSKPKICYWQSICNKSRYHCTDGGKREEHGIVLKWAKCAHCNKVPIRFPSGEWTNWGRKKSIEKLKALTVCYYHWEKHIRTTLPPDKPFFSFYFGSNISGFGIL